MRKAIFMGLGLLLFGQVMADNVIKLNDESLIEDFVSITIDPYLNGNVIIFFADESYVSVNMNLIEVLPNAASAIENPKAGNIARISKVVDDQLSIEGLQGKEQIRIYNVSGNLVHTSKAEADKEIISLQGYSAGTYLLCVGDKVIKFNKR